MVTTVDELPFLADPALVRFGDLYYLYPTTDGIADWGSDSFHALSSADLETWTDHGVVLRLGRDVAWADRHAWAPACVEHDGRYYLYFTADDSIGVAVADSPVGPFIDSGRPIVAEGEFPGRAIDPSVFTDSDGSQWLVWGNGTANFARLDPSMLAIDRSTWARWQHPTFREAAHVHRRGDRYYLTWSENDTRDPSYRVRWAVGAGPTGPWEDRGVLLEQDAPRGILATGHHSILQVGEDDWVIAYHRFARPGGDGFHREIVVDRLVHLPSGDLAPVVPSLDSIRLTTQQTQPVS